MQASAPRTPRPSEPPLDNGKTGEPYWVPVFKGYEADKKWMAEVKPDVVIMVYNDHVNAFDFKIIPTFAIGCADEYRHRRRGLGSAARAAR